MVERFHWLEPRSRLLLERVAILVSFGRPITLFVNRLFVNYVNISDLQTIDQPVLVRQ